MRVEWHANPGPQTDFLVGELADVREVLYGGAKGGGKSAAIGPKVVIHLAAHPEHARVLVLRATYPELVELIDRTRPFFLALGGVWNEQKKTWAMPRGARVRFGHLSNGETPYWGHEYTLIIVDEVTRCLDTEADYLRLLGSLRNSHGIAGQVVLLTNPGGKGHGWVKSRFMNVPPRTVQTDGNGLQRVYIPARLADNPHLPAEYRATLEQMGDAERRAYLDGDWDAFEGSVFRLVPGVHTWTWAQFEERTKHKSIPAHWRRYRAYDHGYARPGCCLWVAVDERGRGYVYREYYTVAKDRNGQPIPNEGAKHEPRHVARRIAELSEGEKYTGSWTGPDLFFEVRGDQAGGVKVATHFEQERVYFTAWKATPGSRIAGKQALHQRLALAEDGYPMLVIIDAPHLVRTLPMLEYDQNNPEDIDSDGEDHAFDAIKGWAVMNPLPTVVRVDDTPKWMKAHGDAARNTRIG